MIDLDGLLFGNPRWEEVVEFWKDDGEFCEERYLVDAIKKHLRTEDQRRRMFNLDVSIEDMLNGRYTGDKSDAVRAIFDEWNAKLGFKAFGS